jgi:mannose-6-phosphate isomerase-like protein (cupin superfamily)
MVASLKKILCVISLVIAVFFFTLMDRQSALANPVQGMSPQRLNSFSGMNLNYLKTGNDTDNTYATTEIKALPNMWLPLHKHQEREAFYVLDGQFTFTVGDREIVAKPGMMLDVPPMMLHSWRNTSTQPSRLLSTNFPGGQLEKFLIAVGHPITSMDSSPVLPNDEDMKLQIDLAPQYGIEVVPPKR